MNSMLSPRLDPDVRRLLEILEAEGGAPMETMSAAEARRVSFDTHGRFTGEREPVASVEDIRVPGPVGDIPLRVYRPAAASPAPGMVFFHGGGWVLCNLETHDTICRAIARRAGAVVVSVDYRLAPEHKFPAALDDSYAAFSWVACNAESLGIDPGRLSVGGDSAGGNLAAAVCLRARDERGPAAALQALVYPVLDLSSIDTPSYVEFADCHRLTRSLMAWFRDHYLARQEDAAHPYASPLLAAHHRGLPPALIVAAECDPLRDEGAAYAARLENAGVPVTYTCYKGMIHPFFSMSGVIPQAYEAFDEVAAAVRHAVAAPR
jgi:acetyl esterase